jgi:hypothetical protein
MIASTFEIGGTLHADGKLILDSKPPFPPGRVRVALRPLVERQSERLPDAPWLDDSIPAPIELPHEHAVIRVQPRVISERLPEALTGLAE